MARHRRRTLTGRRGIKKSHTNVSNTGNGSTPANFIILNPSGGARSIDGAEQNIKQESDTAESCFVGDTVKYVNLHLACVGRDTLAVNETQGFLEWAFCCVKETETQVPATQTGVLTLGNICTNMYRQECIFTGCIPVGHRQAVCSDITLKIPPGKQNISLGDEWRFITFFRSALSTSTATTAVRLIKSYNYKTYT